MTIVSVMNTEVKAQENNFITNEEVKNELVVAKTIFKQDGAQLYRHIRYEYSYDDQKRLTCKEASKWDGAKDEWTPYFKMTYQYGNDEITMSYARWNESHKAYDKDMKKSVYELNDENMRSLQTLQSGRAKVRIDPGKLQQDWLRSEYSAMAE